MSGEHMGTQRWIRPRTRMLTDRDIVLKVLAEDGAPNSVTAGELAQGEAVTIGADDNDTEILRTMAQHQGRRTHRRHYHRLTVRIASGLGRTTARRELATA
jgi:hypothetical protein